MLCPLPASYLYVARASDLKKYLGFWVRSIRIIEEDCIQKLTDLVVRFLHTLFASHKAKLTS
jgi:hypothetical protein